VFIEDIVPSSDQNRRDLMAGSWGKMPHTTNEGTRTLLCYFVLRGKVLVLYSDRDPSHKPRNLSIIATKSLIDSS
jgi:hypothetical protein